MVSMIIRAQRSTQALNMHQTKNLFHLREQEDSQSLPKVNKQTHRKTGNWVVQVAPCVKLSSGSKQGCTAAKGTPVG